MGEEIQLYSHSLYIGGFWETSFAWITPLEEMSYVVTIVWQEVGSTLVPDMIRYGATFVKPSRNKGIWKNSSISNPPKIGQTEGVEIKGTLENETMELAIQVGCERFLKDRVCFVDKESLRSHLKAIADEYTEFFEPFMLATIMGVGSLIDNGNDDMIAQFKKISLPMVRRLYPQLIANHVVSVQPMKGPSALIYYMRSKYGVKKPKWLWFKNKAKKIFDEMKEATKAAIVRWRQRHPGPSWLVQASDPVETA